MNLERLLLQRAVRAARSDQVSRRDFLKTASAATLAALAAGAPRTARAIETGPKPKATADRVIVLWMGGGMAHTETFDPKRYTPYATGMNPDTVLSTSLDLMPFSNGV